MKKMKKVFAIMLTLAMLLCLVACSGKSSLSLTMGVETGDKIKVKLDTTDDLSMKWNKDENVLNVKDDDNLVLSMYFADEDDVFAWVEGAIGSTNVEVKSNGSGNGTKRSIVCVDNTEDGTESANYVVGWIVGSNTGVIARGTASHAETKEVFESLSFSVESTEQSDEYYFLNSVVMAIAADSDVGDQIEKDDNENAPTTIPETEPITEPVVEEPELPVEPMTEPGNEEDEVETSEIESGETEPHDENESDHESAKISDEWTDLDIMIDGVVYHFPYDYDKFVENGWTFNMADYGYENGYIMNKGDKTYSSIELQNDKYGREYNSLSIQCGFQNFGDAAVDIAECDLWTIKIDCMKYSSPYEEYPEVQIAKGIKFGSTIEDVVAAFGECEETYRSEENGYTTYEYVCDFSQYLRFVIYDEFGVTSIELKDYSA